MNPAIPDPRRERIWQEGVETENLEALAEVLQTYAHRLDQALEIYEGEKQFNEAFDLNGKCLRAYRAISKWEISHEEILEEGYIIDEDPEVLKQELMSVDREEYFRRRREAAEKVLEAERTYLDVIRKVEEEVEWPESNFRYNTAGSSSHL